MQLEHSPVMEVMEPDPLVQRKLPALLVVEPGLLI